MLSSTDEDSVSILPHNFKRHTMEDRYSKFKKLNWLLTQSFEAERVYYNAGEDVQQVDLKRFFNHESVNRNRFSYEISEQLVQAGVEPHKDWVQKGNLHRDWRQEKKALTRHRPLKLLKKCRERDEKNLELYEEIIKEKKLPKEVLKVLKRQRNTIVKSLSTAQKFKNGEQTLESNKEPKVLTLKAI